VGSWGSSTSRCPDTPTIIAIWGVEIYTPPWPVPVLCTGQMFLGSTASHVEYLMNKMFLIVQWPWCGSRWCKRGQRGRLMNIPRTTFHQLLTAGTRTRQRQLPRSNARNNIRVLHVPCVSYPTVLRKPLRQASSQCKWSKVWAHVHGLTRPIGSCNQSSKRKNKMFPQMLHWHIVNSTTCWLCN